MTDTDQIHTNLFRLALLILAFACVGVPGTARAEIPADFIPNGNWWRNCASLDMDFVHDKYYINHNTTCDGTVGTVYSGATYGTNIVNFINGAGATFTRASTATYFNSAGVMQTAAANVPRLDYGPGGGNYPLGVLIEESRTNYIQNSTFAGITAGALTNGQTIGTGGHWECLWGGGTNESCTIIDTGTQNGIAYLDIQMIATNPGSAAIFMDFNTIASDQISTTNGTTTIASAWFAVTSYTSTGGTYPCAILLSNRQYPYSNELDDGYYGLLSWQRIVTPALTNSSGQTNSADAWPYMNIPPGATCSITFRFGAPQLEIASFPTSYIPTNGTGTVTRAADAFTLPTTAGGGSGWSAPGVGTIIVSGATAYQRPVDVSGLASLTDGTSNNAINMFFGGTNYGTAPLKFETFISGSSVFGCSSANFTLGTQMHEAYAFQANNLNGAIAGTICSASDQALTLPTLTTLNIGVDRFGTGLDGWVGRITYFPTRQPDASLVDYTR